MTRRPVRMPGTVAIVLLTSGCGAASQLQPKPGQELPVAAYGATKTPTAADLLVPANQARPQRSDELLKKSEERRSDEFSLPPPD